jgi:hypothetical protein
MDIQDTGGKDDGLDEQRIQRIPILAATYTLFIQAII